MNVLCRDANGPRQIRGGCLDAISIRPTGGFLKAEVVLLWELRVDREPHAPFGIVFRTGQTNGIFDSFRRLELDPDILLVLVRRQNLLQDRAHMNFSPGATHLDVGQHPLEITNARREVLHLSETLVHLLQALAHLLERFSKPFLESRSQLFVHRLAHLVELLLIALLETLDSGVKGHPNALQCALVRVPEFLQLGRHAFQMRLLGRAQGRQSVGKRAHAQLEA